MTRRTILAAHPVPGLYGADRMMLTAMQSLADDGDDVTLVVPETGPLLPIVERAGIKTRLVHFPVLRKAVLRPLSLLWLLAATPWHLARLYRVIRRAAPDLVYVNTVTLPHWLVAARLAGVPTVCHVREAEHGMPRVAARLLLLPLRLASAVVANSSATAHWLSAHDPTVSDRVRVIYNGFTFADGPDDRSVVRGRLVVVGRLSPRKGQDVALQALGRLVAAGRDVELEFVGDVFRGYEWYEAGLLEEVARLELAARVRFVGFRTDPTDCYAAAEIVLVPSRLEPFGSVAVEAMALGRPVVATRVGGLAEIIDDERTGLLCPPEDAAALALAVGRLLDDGALARRLGAAGAAKVRERFGMDRFAAQLREVVAAAVTHRAGSGVRREGPAP